MKKAVCIVLVLSIVISFCGCSSSDYNKAVKLYDNGDYSSAEQIFRELGDYKDSQDYLEKTLIGINKEWLDDLASKLEDVYEDVSIKENISGQTVFFSGSAGRNEGRIEGKVNLEQECKEFTISYSDRISHAIEYLKNVTPEGIISDFEGNYTSLGLASVDIMLDVMNYVIFMSRLENTIDTADFYRSAAAALLQSRETPVVFGQWEYRMEIKDDSFSIRAKEVGGSGIGNGVENSSTGTASSTIDTETTDTAIRINKMNRTPLIYQDENCTIAVEDFRYIEGASNLIIVLSITNKSKQLLYVNNSDYAEIDGSEVRFLFDSVHEYDAKWNGISHYYIARKALSSAGVEDFEEVCLSFSILLGDNILAEKKLVVSRDAFSTDW